MCSIKTFFMLLVGVLFCSTIINPATPARAACDPLPTDKGQATLTLTAQTAGQYAVWLRMVLPTAERNSVFIQVDDQCPVAVGDSESGNGFMWINYHSGDKAKTMLSSLTAGAHTIKIAGREAGTGVDKIMLLNNGCAPTDLGQNCLTSSTPTTQAQSTPAPTRIPHWWIIAASIIAALATLGFLIWKYITFIKRMPQNPDQKMTILAKLTQFVRKHMLVVIVGLVVIITSTVVGIASAGDQQPVSEIETATLAGTTKVIENAEASGGKYVMFEQDPAKASAATNEAPAGQGNSGTTGNGGSSGGNSGGNSGGGSSGGSSTSCPLPSYPSANCTGVPAGTSLTVIKGDMTISTANTVIEGKDIRGCVDVTAPGVIIRKSKITADCFYVIYKHTSSGASLLIEDSDISCGDHNGTAIGDTGFTVRRSNIHGCENGFDIDGLVTIEDSYIHDLTQSGNDPHTDGIQITPVAHDVTIKHNTIYAFTGGGNGTSAIITPSSAISNILIQDNLVAGGAYTIYCRETGSHSNFRLINNHFSTIYGPHVGAYGPWTGCENESTVSGNVYHESGQPVPLS